MELRAFILPFDVEDVHKDEENDVKDDWDETENNLVPLHPLSCRTAKEVDLPHDE